MKAAHIAAPESVGATHDAEPFDLEGVIEQSDARKEREHEIAVGGHDVSLRSAAAAISAARLISQSGSAPVCAATRSAVRLISTSTRSTLPQSACRRRSSHHADACHVPSSDAVLIAATCADSACASAFSTAARI